MSTLSVPVDQAKKGLKITTKQLTTIQVRLASMEILVGGPYDGHTYGHAALRVTTISEDRVYDYGRYGRTWSGGSEGQGILRIWTEFNAYIAAENALGRTTIGFLYEIPEESAFAINAFFNAKIARKELTSAKAKMKAFWIDSYNALGPNCTTLTVAAAKLAHPELDKQKSDFQKGEGLSYIERGLVSASGWPTVIFMPADLQHMLSSATAPLKYKRSNTYIGKS